MIFTISEKEGKHQGDDFILEGKVQRQKILASKRSDTETMWQNVSCSLDDIINITKSVSDKLHIHDIWKVLLLHTNYLVKFAGRNLTYNICM